MIITCNNCNKNFDLDSNLIPEKGRLLQCNSCDHKWFFKKEVLEKEISPINDDTSIDNINIFDQNNSSINDDTSIDNINIFDQNNSSINDEESLLNTPNDEVEVDLEEETKEKIEINIDKSPQKNNKLKKQKNFKILNIFIVAIISSVAFIIIVDTFKYPIGKIVPNIEFILYNLYESIKDISLFIRDLT